MGEMGMRAGFSGGMPLGMRHPTPGLQQPGFPAAPGAPHMPPTSSHGFPPGQYPQRHPGQLINIREQVSVMQLDYSRYHVR